MRSLCLGVVLSACLGWVLGPVEATPILISEVFYDAIGSDAGREFIELAGPPGFPLDGYRLVGRNGDGGGPIFDIALDGDVIRPNGLFVLAASPPAGVDPVIGADRLASFALQNGPDGLELVEGGLIVDALAYGNFGGVPPPFGEGSAAQDVTPGMSLERLSWAEGNDNFSDFSPNPAPSPGLGPLESAIPEPRTGFLLGCGIAALVLARRRLC